MLCAQVRHCHRGGLAQVWYVKLLLGTHSSASLCRDGQETKWRLQCVLAFKRRYFDRPVVGIPGSHV